MKFSINKQNNDYNFFVSHNKAVVMVGTVGTKKQAFQIIFDIIRELLLQRNVVKKHI